jgi:hypothetical protein
MTIIDHPCKETCSGWKQGYEKGAACEREKSLAELAKEREKAAEFIVALECVVHHEYGRADIFDTMKNTVDRILSKYKAVGV